MWVRARAKMKAGGRMQSGWVLTALGLGISAAWMLLRRRFRRR